VVKPVYTYNRSQATAADNIRQAAGIRDLERPAQNVVNLCRELNLLLGRLESSGKLMFESRPELATEVMTLASKMQSLAGRLTRDVEDELFP